MREFVYRILDDDHGISEDAWGALVTYLRELEEFELLNEVIGKVKSGTGRRYVV